jgi:hypothetical protein
LGFGVWVYFVRVGVGGWVGGWLSRMVGWVVGWLVCISTSVAPPGRGWDGKVDLVGFVGGWGGCSSGSVVVWVDDPAA